MAIRIDRFIEGIPYPKAKTRGDTKAAERWTQVVIGATRGIPKARGRVSLNLRFVLPEDKYPKDHPYGTDLDNLLKRFLDALCDTILSEVEGKDGAVVRLTVSKRQARKNELTGVRMILSEIQTKPIRFDLSV